MQIKTTLDEYPINELVAAVIEHAHWETRHGNAEAGADALAWLETDAPLWADAIGIDLYQTIPRWIARQRSRKAAKPANRRITGKTKQSRQPRKVKTAQEALQTILTA